MLKPSFYWHDYETWGVNPRIDRPCQFAGIRTDQELNIIGEPLMIYSQPGTDFLPHPESVLITGITPQHAAAEGVTEAKFFKLIHAELSRPASCIVGYNSLRFDEEVTRFGFYRNFIDPYAYSWKNSNSRWDVLDLMRLAHALRPEGIHWPQNESGVTSFKLTDLTAANEIQQEGAHDALVDVKATIALARLVKQKQPKLFDFYFELRQKQRAAAVINLPAQQILLHVSGMFPAEQGCLAPIVPVLANPSNPNEIICYNLRVNPQALLAMDAKTIQQKLYIKTQDLEPGEQRLALKGVHLNKSPALAPMTTLTPAQAQKWQIDQTEIERHYQMLVADSTLISRLQQVYSQRPEFEPGDADSALYDGFIGNEDRLRCNQLLAASPEQLADWKPEAFQDKRLQTLLFRYRARNYPQTLSSDEVSRWQQFCSSRLLDGDAGSSLTLDQFQQLMLTLVQQHQGQREQQLLGQLSLWVQGMAG